ncbi:hypothetical protein CI102_7672 [Trichoderma harzianum]|uniref:Uncharacterized protein n=1 Tax=Trichoderma harzianum CBS 226.95 TaxID=983964 RepID=A0A2T4A6S9_TRIHA|nr:hypothetical protein M431DRAFT_7232 [Trichoderma harzianum CBS 226.95]PKK48052.1 hypothetical protein CI102_7672 [Trichoderma harzianum]PTB52718.1 hypothetical protein M431DRAFT_7232 [Trichoderma harzianum CBS 226.95]
MTSSIHLPLMVLAVSQATCVQALTVFPRDSFSSQSLPLSATIGIIVGVISIFALATVLFIIYFARQRPSPYIEQRYYYREEYVSPKALVEPWGYVVNQPHHGTDLEATANMNDGASETNGQYYNRMEEAARYGHIQLTHDPRAVIHGPDNAMPAHHAYDPNTVSKKDSRASSTRSLSPPRPTHRLRPSTPDSFIIQAYKSVVEDASRQSALQSPPTSGQPALPSPSSQATSSPTLRSSSRWSSRLSSLSLPKIHMPKRNAPPSLVLQPMAMARTSGDRQLHITPPLLNDPRFIDRPLGAGIVVVDRNRPPTPRSSEKYAAYTEVPLASGKSVLYGI